MAPRKMNTYYIYSWLGRLHVSEEGLQIDGQSIYQTGVTRYIFAYMRWPIYMRVCGVTWVNSCPPASQAKLRLWPVL